MDGYYGIGVEMKSDYGKKIDIELCVGKENYLKMEIEYGDTGVSSGPKESEGRLIILLTPKINSIK